MDYKGYYILKKVDTKDNTNKGYVYSIDRNGTYTDPDYTKALRFLSEASAIALAKEFSYNSDTIQYKVFKVETTLTEIDYQF